MKLTYQILFQGVHLHYSLFTILPLRCDPFLHLVVSVFPADQTELDRVQTGPKLTKTSSASYSNPLPFSSSSVSFDMSSPFLLLQYNHLLLFSGFAHSCYQTRHLRLFHFEVLLVSSESLISSTTPIIAILLVIPFHSQSFHPFSYFL